MKMMIETIGTGTRRSDRIEFNPQKYLLETVVIRHADIHHGGKMRRADGAAL